jgi:hypothetical protein
VHVNFLRYVKLRIDITEDGLSKERDVYFIHVWTLNDYIEITFCQNEYVNTVTNSTQPPVQWVSGLSRR